jgi:Golgi phosphoprotein 3 (GPP34)
MTTWFPPRRGAHAEPAWGSAAAQRIPPAAAPSAWLSPGEDPAARVADDLFLVAHRDRDGKPLLPARVMGLALAGGLLTELALFQRVAISERALVVVSDIALAEHLAQSLLAQLLAQPQPLPVADWLAYLAPGAPDAVGHRLVRAGTVRPQQRRRGWRFVPADTTDAFFRAGRLAVMLDNAKSFTVPQKALLGLVQAAGLVSKLPCVDLGEARRLVAATVQSLPWPLSGLIAETTAAIDKAVITGRT